MQVVLEGLLKMPQVAARDREAVFERLLRRHEQMVLRVAYRMLGNRDDAEDAAQEVFLRLHKHLESLDPEGGTASWLYRTAMNVCYDQIRRRHPVEALEMDVPFVASQLSELLLEERRSLMQRALLSLPERERAAVVLREIEGLETAEVAAILGVTEVTVRSQVSMARTKLRAWMERRSR